MIKNFLNIKFTQQVHGYHLLRICELYFDNPKYDTDRL